MPFDPEFTAEGLRVCRVADPTSAMRGVRMKVLGEPGWLFSERRYLTRIPPDNAAG